MSPLPYNKLIIPSETLAMAALRSEIKPGEDVVTLGLVPAPVPVQGETMTLSKVTMDWEYTPNIVTTEVIFVLVAAFVIALATKSVPNLYQN